MKDMKQKIQKLKNGWTTGACATAALKASLNAIVNGKFENSIEITLPKGQKAKFKIEEKWKKENMAAATIIKDAGDDPDITHNARIKTIVKINEGNTGVIFKAGRGIGIVTKPGLPIEIGQPAITPTPKQMMEEVIDEICRKHKMKKNMEIIIEIENGEEIARQTWNPQLGIVGGLSILGTTGIVQPYSCSAWIHSIHRGIDVARAENVEHVIAATGTTSQNIAREIYKLPKTQCIDMGDFVGGTLKYLRKYPIAKVTIAGGFAKMVKLAQGEMDLHSKRSKVDMESLTQTINEISESKISEKIKKEMKMAKSAAQVLEIIKQEEINLPKTIGERALGIVNEKMKDTNVKADIIIVNRTGEMLAHVKE